MNRNINIITLNTAVDRLMEIQDFTVGRITRAEHSLSYPSGKGINTARCLDALDVACRVYGFVGGRELEYFRTIDSENVTSRFITVKAETRNNITIITQKGELILHVQNRGMWISEEAQELLLESLRRNIRSNSINIISGSLPQNIEVQIYNKMIRTIKRANAKVILDTSEKYLEASVVLRPNIVKPNIKEFENLTKKNYINEREICIEMKKYNEKGIDTFVVSLGEDGALVSAANTKYVYKAKAKEDFRHTKYDEIGCGDSMIAGFAQSLSEDSSIENLIVNGVACGTANLFKKGPGNIDLDVYKKTRERVEIKKIML